MNTGFFDLRKVASDQPAGDHSGVSATLDAIPALRPVPHEPDPAQAVWRRALAEPEQGQNLARVVRRWQVTAAVRVSARGSIDDAQLPLLLACADRAGAEPLHQSPRQLIVGHEWDHAVDLAVSSAVNAGVTKVYIVGSSLATLPWRYPDIEFVMVSDRVVLEFIDAALGQRPPNATWVPRANDHSAVQSLRAARQRRSTPGLWIFADEPLVSPEGETNQDLIDMWPLIHEPSQVLGLSAATPAHRDPSPKIRADLPQSPAVRVAVRVDGGGVIADDTSAPENLPGVWCLLLDR